MERTRRVNLQKEKYDVYIGRPSKFGNPYSHLDGTLAEYRVKNREEAIEAYRSYILKNPALMAEILELRGKRLGCFCPPGLACHGDIIVEILEGHDAKEPRE